MNRAKWKLFFIVPLFTVGLTAALDYLEVFQPLQQKAYRFLVDFQEEVPVSERILQVVVDEEFTNANKMAEPPRDHLAEGIVLLREFGAEQLILFDDFSKKSPPGLNPDYLLENRFLLSGRAGEAGEKELAELIRDRDIYLGEALVFFGPVYVPVFPSAIQDPAASENISKRIEEEHTFSKEIGNEDLFGETAHIISPVTPIAAAAAGFGIPGSAPVIRHIELFKEYRDGYLPQIAFLSLFHWFGRPEIMLFEDRLILLQADLPGGEVKDLLIPLGPNGSMILYRPPDYEGSPFSRISFQRIMLHHQLEHDLVSTLQTMERLGFFESGPLTFYRKALALKKRLMRAGPRPGEEAERAGPAAAEYVELRKQFFTAAGTFLKGTAEQELLSAYEEKTAEIEKLFSEGRGSFASLVELRKELIEASEGSLCIYGRAGPEVEVNAALANAFLQEAFYDEFPWWYAIGAAAVLAFLLSFFMSRVKAYLGAVIGFLIVALITAGFGGSFILTGIFIPPAAAAAALLLTYLVCLTVSIVAGGYEKRWMRMIYGRSFPPEVVPAAVSLLKNNSLIGESAAATGGCFNFQQIHKAVSGLEPKGAVALTAEAVESIRRVILSARGSVSLSGNESCTALFGAPVESKQAVSSACAAALFMRQKDLEINTLLNEKGINGNAYRTVIGMHTGNLVIGNIGGGTHINYTVTGLGAVLLVKLAAANRQYGTMIIVTEETKGKTEGKTEEGFVFRALDRVRAEETSLPVRIYELVSRRESLPAETAELLRVFEEGRLLFEKREWVAAHKKFIEALKIDKKDGPSELFARRCQKFVKSPPASSWDGVFSLPN